MQITLYVQPEENGFLLRDVLHNHQISSGLSRAVKRAGGFWRGAQPVHTNVRVRAGDEIVFVLPPERETTVEAEQLPLDVVYEDAHTMVLNKPAGQAVHPTLGYAAGTLANAFCGEMRRRGKETVFRPINRIDRNTSGLVLCAKNAYAAPLLAQSVQKIYYAILQGELPGAQGTIDAPIACAEGSVIQRCVRPDGKPSVTQYTVLAAQKGYTLVRCVPVTGRTHQLRVHFAYLGFPLAGDDLYGGRTDCMQRHALHCGEMNFCRVECVETRERGTLTETAGVHLALPEDMRKIVRRFLPEGENRDAAIQK